MGKNYYIEVKLGNKWILREVTTRQSDAFQYVTDHVGERYPMRVVKVERTIVFDGSK